MTQTVAVPHAFTKDQQRWIKRKLHVSPEQWATTLLINPEQARRAIEIVSNPDVCTVQNPQHPRHFRKRYELTNRQYRRIIKGTNRDLRGYA